MRYLTLNLSPITRGRHVERGALYVNIHPITVVVGIYYKNTALYRYSTSFITSQDDDNEGEHAVDYNNLTKIIINTHCPTTTETDSAVSQ